MASHAHPTTPRTVLLGTKRLRQVPIGSIEFKSVDPHLSLDLSPSRDAYAFPIKVGDLVYTVTYTVREPRMRVLRFLPNFLRRHVRHEVRAVKLEITKEQYYSDDLMGVITAQRWQAARS